MNAVSNLKEMALVVTAALGGGLLLERFRQPAILGYILAGILLGPSGLELLTDTSTIHYFADLGVLMVLFLVGMNLNLREFKKSIIVSISTALLQILMGLLIAFTMAVFFDWPAPLAILLGFLLALSSTAVVVKILENGDSLNTEGGRLTIGILIAQDLAIVPMILVLKGAGTSINWVMLLAKIIFTLSLLSLLVWFLSRKRKVQLLLPFPADHPELPSLVGIAFCFGFAALSGFLGLSVAYGAFIAGLILGNSREHTIMLQVMTPIYSILVMAFFLSIGLLMDVPFIIRHFWSVLTLLTALILGKTLINVGILRLLRQSWPATILSAVILSQIGEFSFLLLSLGAELKILSRYQQQLLMTLTALSLAITPLWLAISRRLHRYHLERHADFATTLSVYKALLKSLFKAPFFSRRKKMGRSK
jgi:CPA2 family monovalent cation:H+ antiporter-2